MKFLIVSVKTFFVDVIMDLFFATYVLLFYILFSCMALLLCFQWCFSFFFIGVILLIAAFILKLNLSKTASTEW